MTEMTPLAETRRSMLARTLWRIETGLTGPLTLGTLAALEGVSPFHLSRGFAVAFGQSPMAYVKARRLSEAAIALCETDRQIVEIAFDACYDSHEGFSRAFRSYFGHAPRAVRTDPSLSLALQEALTMPNNTAPDLTPEFVTRKEERLVGLARRYTMANRAKIPQLWQEAIDEIGQAMFGTVTYGACYDFEDEAFTYMVGLTDDGRVDGERLDHVILPAGEYAVFKHEGHISTIADTWRAIFDAWMPSSGVVPGEGPEFERYEIDFDVEKPGGVSIWIPIKRAG